MSAEVVNGLTVDLEDWYQGLTSTNRQFDRWPEFEDRVAPATERVLTLLREFGVQATFFVLGYVARMHPDLVERIAAEGHEIGLHGHSHRRVDRLTPTGFREELQRGLETLVPITDQLPTGHRAPYFSISRQSLWAFDVLVEFGFHYDASLFPTRNMLYGFPGAPRWPVRLVPSGLVEFPASIIRVGPVTVPIAGGFYLRAAPAKWIVWSIRRLNRQGYPAILYLHPWELDPDHPRPACVTVRERITHYTGLAAAQHKWRYVLERFRFAPLGTLVDSVRETAALTP
ncbi:MAG: DUF3473 domain-containing protein [Anaerolineae bacterium]